MGPESQEQCHPQVLTGGACDFKYNLCQAQLVCKKGMCTTQANAFKGELDDECGGPEGRVCEAGLDCNSWRADTAGKCKKVLHRGLSCYTEHGSSRCEKGTSCEFGEGGKKKRCYEKKRKEGDNCISNVECLNGLVCVVCENIKKFKCRIPETRTSRQITETNTQEE